MGLLTGMLAIFSAHATGRFYNPSWDTVMDTVNAHLWQAHGSAERHTLYQALRYCDSLQLAGYTDWRLPHIKELASLVDETSYNPSVYPYFETQSELYWSSTTLALADDDRFSWAMNFSDGHMHPFRHDNGHYTRCVRNTELPEFLQ